MTNESTGKKTNQPGQGGEDTEPEPSQTQASAPQSGPSTREKRARQQTKQQSGAQPEPQPEPQPRQFDAGITQGCIELVEAYRRGDKARGVVVFGLAKRLGLGNDGEGDPAASAAFETYCAQLAEVDDARKGSKSQPGSRRPTPGGEHQEQEQEWDRGRSRTLGKSKGKRRADRRGTRSRSRSSRESRSRSISPLSLSEDEPASKRQKPDPSEYAWAAADAAARKTLRPEVLDTLLRLKRYGKDIRFAKSHLLNSVGAPEFPDAEWSNVLRGKFVDLDHVFSGQYTLGVDEKHTEKFGPVELSYRAITPSKTIKTAGDWVIAWQRATAAIVYAFPLRKADLDGYFTHIFGLFGAIHPDYHSRVLDYDRAARQKAAAVRTILLTDIHEFAFLRTLYIDSIGATAATSAGPSSDGKKRTASTRKVPSDEPCRRWNRGICNASDSACKYTHRCSACGTSGHPATGCPKDSKRK